MEHNQAGIVMVIQRWAVYKYESVTIHNIRLEHRTGDNFLLASNTPTKSYMLGCHLFWFEILKDSDNNNKITSQKSFYFKSNEIKVVK